VDGVVFDYDCVNIKGGRAMKKAVSSVLSLMFLASTAVPAVASEEAVLKCRWFATGEVEGRLKLIEGKEFKFPVDVERGFFYYLENGMKEEQKKALARAGKEFLKQVNQLRKSGKGEVFAPIGFVCRDKETKEGVVILYFKD
jgi:hypothetical protein